MVQERFNGAVEKTKEVIDTANRVSCISRIVVVLLFISLLVLVVVSYKNMFRKRTLDKH